MIEITIKGDAAITIDELQSAIFNSEPILKPSKLKLDKQADKNKTKITMTQLSSVIAGAALMGENGSFTHDANGPYEFKGTLLLMPLLDSINEIIKS